MSESLHFVMGNVFFVVFMCFILISLQVKDAVNAGNLLYKLGKVEFENVYFNYTDG